MDTLTIAVATSRPTGRHLFRHLLRHSAGSNQPPGANFIYQYIVDTICQYVHKCTALFFNRETFLTSMNSDTSIPRWIAPFINVCNQNMVLIVFCLRLGTSTGISYSSMPKSYHFEFVSWPIKRDMRCDEMRRDEMRSCKAGEKRRARKSSHIFANSFEKKQSVIYWNHGYYYLILHYTVPYTLHHTPGAWITKNGGMKYRVHAEDFVTYEGTPFHSLGNLRWMYKYEHVFKYRVQLPPIEEDCHNTSNAFL